MANVFENTTRVSASGSCCGRFANTGVLKHAALEVRRNGISIVQNRRILDRLSFVCQLGDVVHVPGEMSERVWSLFAEADGATVKATTAMAAMDRALRIGKT